MSLSTQLSDELKQLSGLASAQPHTTGLNGPDGIQVQIDFTAVDRLSSSFRELRLQVPALVDADIDVLKQWAEKISQRVNYLLENIGPLEIDPDAGQVLIRSTPPAQQLQGSKFYEMLLQSQTDGQFSLRRYLTEKGRPGRTQVDIQTTHEVLDKLLNDLVDTIPSDP